jgi:hypothetical protein
MDPSHAWAVGIGLNVEVYEDTSFAASDHLSRLRIDRGTGVSAVSTKLRARCPVHLDARQRYGGSTPDAKGEIVKTRNRSVSDCRLK